MVIVAALLPCAGHRWIARGKGEASKHIRNGGTLTGIRKDIAGQRFGSLTALCPTGEIRSGRSVWRCRCDCGNAVDETITRLTTGGATSCGCMNLRRAKDLRGMRFGRLVVTSLSDMKRGRDVLWRCRCDCGGSALVRTCHLTGGQVRSCGCLKRDRYDITGEKRGRLTALSKTGRTDGNGFAIYRWQCDCGNIVERSCFGTLGEGKNPQCPECLKKLKIAQANAIRESRKVDPGTGLTLSAMKSIIAGKPTAANSSGIRGVSWHRGKQKWVVTGSRNGRKLYLGAYENIEDARDAREKHVMKVYGSKTE